MRVLLTGAAGFIGMHVALRLLRRGDDVIGVDNLDGLYDVQLKRDRLSRLSAFDGFSFANVDIADRGEIAGVFDRERPSRVVNLAAQGGPGSSAENPSACVDSNVHGFANVLEECRVHDVEHLVYGSSAGVYGANTALPFSVHQNVDHPLSLDAATKRANELMAHAYSHLYRLPSTGLRFFSVYGPWGRPDMVLFRFTKAILEGAPIDLYNFGAMRRDFTYVDDAAECVVRALDRPPEPCSAWSAESPDPAASAAPYRVFNVGNGTPVALGYLVDAIERCVGRTAVYNLMPMRPGDMAMTCADVTELWRHVDYRPATPIEDGVERFVEWYCAYYGARERAANTVLATAGLAIAHAGELSAAALRVEH